MTCYIEIFVVHGLKEMLQPISEEYVFKIYGQPLGTLNEEHICDITGPSYWSICSTDLLIR